MWNGIKENLKRKIGIPIYIYVYKQDLALNNMQWLICHKTQPTICPVGGANCILCSDNTSYPIKEVSCVWH